MGDTKEIYELFKDPQQRILQIAALCPDQEIKVKVMAYSGSGPSGPDKALKAFKQTGYSTTFERHCHSKWTYRDYYNL